MGLDQAASVLLIDDDEALLRAQQRAFVRLGFTVSTATSVPSAFEALATLRPDLAVVDLRLGLGSGLDVVDRLSATAPDCTIAVVSAYLSVAATAAAIRRGADVVMFKPALPEEILHKIDLLEPSLDDIPTPTLARAEWEHINRVLSDCNGNVSQAARKLGIFRQSLQRKLRKHPPSH